MLIKALTWFIAGGLVVVGVALVASAVLVAPVVGALWLVERLEDRQDARVLRGRARRTYAEP
jgi:hypothetical protein